MTEKETDNKDLLERVEKIEKESKAKDELIAKLTQENQELTGKLASVKVDSLTRKVDDDPTPVATEEEITFDFDM